MNQHIIDSHIHITQWIREDGQLVFDTIMEYQEKAGIAFVDNMCCTSNGDLWGGFEMDQSIIGALAKLENPTVFTHGCLYIPPETEKRKAFRFKDQLEELMELGLDGVKICDFKPDAYVRLGVEQLLEEYEDYIACCEKYGVHMCWHVADPDYFWDPDKVDEELKRVGWFYGTEGYPTYNSLITMAYQFLEAFPNLKVTLAHSFFKSYEPEEMVALFEKYPNVTIDLAPGWEMFCGFAAHYDAWHSIFRNYSDQILFATDGTTSIKTEVMCRIAEIVRKFLETDDYLSISKGRESRGIKLEQQYLDNIYCKNHENILGAKPREINRRALKKYIEKYLPLMPDSQNRSMTYDYYRKNLL